MVKVFAVVDITVIILFCSVSYIYCKGWSPESRNRRISNFDNDGILSSDLRVYVSMCAFLVHPVALVGPLSCLLLALVGRSFLMQAHI
jgi:hypothetical protein